MYIQLPTGKTISISYYQFLFELEDDDVDDFYQSCMADDLGREIQNPFSNKASKSKLEFEEIPDNEEDTEEEL